MKKRELYLPIIRSKALSILVLVGVCLLACSCETAVAENETWELTEILSQDIVNQTETYTREAKNCGVPEPKTATCSAGTSNEFSFVLGGGINIQIVSVGANIGTSLGFDRSRGEDLGLEVPPEGYIYRYEIMEAYELTTGRVQAVSSNGETREGTYTFKANCSLSFVSREDLSCDGASLESSPPESTEREPSPPEATEIRSTDSSNTPSFNTLILVNSTYDWPIYMGLHPGTVSLAENIPFEVGHEMATRGCNAGWPDTTLSVRADVNNPTIIYLLVNSGNGFSMHQGKKIGEIQFIFSTGVYSIDLILGETIRDWVRDPTPGVVTTITSSYIREVWSGTHYDGRMGRVDMHTLEVPTQYQSSLLETVTINDTSGGDISSGNDPCIQLQAITIKTD